VGYAPSELVRQVVRLGANASLVLEGCAAEFAGSRFLVYSETDAHCTVSGDLLQNKAAGGGPGIENALSGRPIRTRRRDAQ